MKPDENLCTRCSAASVSYDDDGACYVCQSCGYVLSQELSTRQDATEHTAGPNLVLPSSSYGGGGGLIDVTTDVGTRGAYGGESTTAGQARVRRQRRQVDELQGLAAALRLPGPVIRTACCLLTQIQQAAREASAKRRRVDGVDNDNDDPSWAQAAAPMRWVPGGGDEPYSDGDDDGALYDCDGGSEAVPLMARGQAAAPLAPAEAEAWTHARDSGAYALGEQRDPGAAGTGSRSEGAAPRPPPALSGQESAARLGALLYLASRSEGGTMTLMEVAERTSSDYYRLAEFVRDQAAFLRLSLPLVDVERYVLRMARQLVASGQLQQHTSGSVTGLSLAGPDHPGGAGGGGARAGGEADASADADTVAAAAAAAATPASETAVWRHPLVRLASQLTELVMRRGWHEGRAPRTVAGALLSICLDSLYPEKAAAARAGRDANPAGGERGDGVSGLTASQLRQSVMCGKSQLCELKQEIVGHLLRLASGLPFAALVGRANVAAYLDVLIAAEGVAEGIRQR